MAEETKQPAAPKAQTFNLKDAESQTLRVLQGNHQASFATVLSLLATERMGYKVTQRTQFKLNAEMTEIEISELPEDVPTANAEQPKQPPAEAESGAVAAK
jgi:hypothetical protein